VSDQRFLTIIAIFTIPNQTQMPYTMVHNDIDSLTKKIFIRTIYFAVHLTTVLVAITGKTT